MQKLVSRRFLVRCVLPCALMIGALVCWFSVRKPLTAEDVVRAAVRDVNREELRWHTAVWKRLPKMFTDMASSFSPKDVGGIRMAAFQQLESLAPQSDLVVTTLLGVLQDKSRAPHEHASAILVLGNIGPFAKAAVDPLLEIANSSANVTNRFQYDLRGACLSALSTIAPTDERWLDTVIQDMQQKSGGFSGWLSLVPLLQQNAALYDEKVQERLVGLMRADQELKVHLIRVVGRIQPNSSRTLSLLVEYLRDKQARGAVVTLLNEQPVRRAEIVRELNDLLTELRAESPPNAFDRPSFGDGRPPTPQDFDLWQRYNRSRYWSMLRRSTISALGRMGPIASETVPVLTGYMIDPDPEVRSKSATALFRITGDFGAVERTFMEMLASETPEVRKLAVGELGQISPECPASVPHLIRSLEDKEFKVRENAILGLVAAGTNGLAALPHLRSMTNDRSPAIQYEAKVAIGKIGGSGGSGSR